MVDVLSATPKKTDFLFLSRYQLQIALSGNGWDLASSSQCWDFECFEDMKIMFVLSQSPWNHVCISSVVSERCCFLLFIGNLWLLQSLHSLTYTPQSLRVKGLTKTSNSVLGVSKSHSLHILSHHDSLSEFPSTVSRSLSDKG